MLAIHQDAWPFLEPVNLEEVPDYGDTIKQPMDLGTVKRKLFAHQYAAAEQFVADVRLVFSNALSYNAPDTRIFAWATKVSQSFERELVKLEQGMCSVLLRLRACARVCMHVHVCVRVLTGHAAAKEQEEIKRKAKAEKDAQRALQKQLSSPAPATPASVPATPASAAPSLVGTPFSQASVSVPGATPVATPATPTIAPAGYVPPFAVARTPSAAAPVKSEMSAPVRTPSNGAAAQPQGMFGKFTMYQPKVASPAVAREPSVVREPSRGGAPAPQFVLNATPSSKRKHSANGGDDSDEDGNVCVSYCNSR